MRLSLLVGVFAGMVLLIAFGCLAEPSGTLAISWPEAIRALDPHAHDNVRIFWGIVGANIFDHLVEKNAQGEIVPGLATSWEAVESDVWEFSLRQGVKFHNGEPFNADVVKYTFERMVRMNAPCLFLFGSIDYVEVVDEYTARIHTIGPNGALLHGLTMAEMVPPVAGEDPNFNLNPVGTGPFKFEEWIRGERFSMIANEDYWGKVPELERVIHYPLLEAFTRAAALKTGQVQIIHHVPLEEIDALKADSRFEIVPMPGNDVTAFAMGHDKIYGDLRIREAMAWAIDTEEMVDVIFGDGAVAGTALMAPPVFGYTDTSDWLPGYDPQRAKELLAAAGYPNGFDTYLIVPAGYWVKGEEVSQYLRQQLLQVGIDMEIRLTEPATTWAILDSEDFDMIMSGWGTITLDCDMGLYRNFHSSMTREHFDNFFVDEMLDFGRASSDQEARREAYEKALVEISTKLLRIPLYVANHVYGISTRVHGFEPRSDELFDNLEYVTVDE